MGRRFIQWLACWVALGVAAEVAQANDRNVDSASRSRESIAAVSGGHETHAVLAPRDPAARSIEATFASRPNDATVQPNGKQAGSAPSREHKGVTLFQFDSKLGHIAVQPVVGAVKGAQFSINF
jgi:hypothetical protein